MDNQHSADRGVQYTTEDYQNMFGDLLKEDERNLLYSDLKTNNNIDVDEIMNDLNDDKIFNDNNNSSSSTISAVERVDENELGIDLDDALADLINLLPQEQLNIVDGNERNNNATTSSSQQQQVNLIPGTPITDEKENVIITINNTENNTISKPPKISQPPAKKTFNPMINKQPRQQYVLQHPSTNTTFTLKGTNKNLIRDDEIQQQIADTINPLHLSEGQTFQQQSSQQQRIVKKSKPLNIGENKTIQRQLPNNNNDKTPNPGINSNVRNKLRNKVIQRLRQDVSQLPNIEYQLPTPIHDKDDYLMDGDDVKLLNGYKKEFYNTLEINQTKKRKLTNKGNEDDVIIIEKEIINVNDNPRPSTSFQSRRDSNVSREYHRHQHSSSINEPNPTIPPNLCSSQENKNYVKCIPTTK